MENWGCEYLDFLNIQVYQYKEIKKSFIEIPSALIEKMLDKHNFEKMIIKDSSYIQELKVDIIKNGLLKPGQITVGANGATLSDGNHRFAACKQLGYKTFPVQVFKSDNPVKVGGLKNREFVMELLGILNDN